MRPLKPNEHSDILRVRFAESDIRRIDKIATLIGLTRSEFIRLMYNDAIAEFEDTETETQAVGESNNVNPRPSRDRTAPSDRGAET